MHDRMFGAYRLDGLLARGGMGEVHRAYDTDHQRVVALKLLLESVSGDLEYRARFVREAKIAAQLRDPHIIPIHSFGEIDNRLYLDMRLIEGSDLRTVLAHNTAIDAARAVAIVEQVASALNTAHEHGLIHRDVKPANVLLTRGRAGRPEFVYLADFGIARSTDPAINTSLTATGTLVGTSAYMAPERYLDEPIDQRVDVYALACVLYQCLTGHRPFRGDEPVAQMQGHVLQPPPRPTERVPTLAAGFDDVIARGMAKRPDDRYGTAGDLAAAARAVIGPLRHVAEADATEIPAPRPLPAEREVVALQTRPAPTEVVSPRVPAAERKPVGRTLPWTRRFRRGRVVAALAVGAVIVAVASLIATAPWQVAAGGQPDPCGSARSGATGVSIQKVAMAPAGRLAYLIVAGSGSIAIMDVAYGTRVGCVPIGGAPAGLTMAADGKRLYVANFDAPMSVVDTATNAVVGTVGTPGDKPTGIATTAIGSWAYVTGNTGVDVLDTSTGKVTGTIPARTGRPIGSLVAAPDGRKIYFTDRSGVSVIDAQLWKVLKVVPTVPSTAVEPRGIAITPDGSRLLVAHTTTGATGETPGEMAGLVTVIDTASDSVVATIATGPLPWSMATAADNRTAYVTQPGMVSVIDIVGSRVMRTIPIRGGGAQSIVITPDGRSAVVTTGESDKPFQLIDLL